MKKLKLKVLAASVLAGFVGVSGTAQADSVFAPLVMSDIANGWYTVISLKVRGNGNVNAGSGGSIAGDLTKLHYVYNTKSTNLAGMFNDPLQECTHLDGSGNVSSWDMLTHTVDPLIDFVAKAPGIDQSNAFTPFGFLAGNNFYGNIVISDVANLDSANEGNLSGHAEVYQFGAGIMLDYKLLNNHRSTALGNFAPGFVSKASADLAWNPVNRDITLWLGVATGTNTGTFGTNYGATISQATKPGSNSPAAPHTDGVLSSTGVYDNDEVNISGDLPYAFNCMSFFGRPQIIAPGALPLTADGGWTRKSIIPTGGGSGAMIYKAALKLFPSTNNLQIAFNSETSGHLNPGAPGGEHPNRPF